MWKAISLSLMITLAVAASPSPVNETAMRRTTHISAVKTLKQSDAWIAMTNQLAQYDAHYADATNKIAQVTDAKTQVALAKSLKAVDDCHDALVKLIKCFQDYVQADNP